MRSLVPRWPKIVGLSLTISRAGRLSFSRQFRIIASMAKLSLNLAALLVLAARVILAQTADGAAAASRGPDAVAANLVNTVCASCHSLDRVNGKKADLAGWTTT